MSKKLLFTISFVLTTVLVQAQQIKVEYENKITALPELMQQFFTMQNVQHSRLTIKGSFNGKRAKIKKVICNKGSFIESELIPDYVHFVFADSIETLDFMAVPYGEDSLRITCFYPEHFNSIIFNDTVRIDKMKSYWKHIHLEIARIFLSWLIPPVFLFKMELGFVACVIPELRHVNGMKNIR